jgi:hypothetical protein
MKLAERDNRLTFFILNHSQKELIDNALKKQSQQMRQEHVNIIKLINVRVINMKKAENMNEEQE